MTTKEYGTWADYGSSSDATVEGSVSVALGEHADDYDLTAICADYRDAINSALPEGVTLNGDVFYGPHPIADRDWGEYPTTDDGYLDIAAIIAEGDDQEFWPIVERHDISQVMSPAQLQATREILGLTGDWLAGHLRVDPRTVRSWEQGRYCIPDGVSDEIIALEAQTAQTVREYIAELEDESRPVMVTYRSDEDYQAAYPDSPFPARWHRAVAARVRQALPDLRIKYA